MKSAVALLLVLSCITIVVNGYVIDTYAENSGTAATNFFCACVDSNRTCYIDPVNSNVSAGNHRAEILQPQTNPVRDWQQDCRAALYEYYQGESSYQQYCSYSLQVNTGCPVTGCTGRYGAGGQLSFSTPPNGIGILYNIWDGGCASNFSSLNPTGLGGVDLTDGGISDSVRILIGKIDLATVLNIYVFTDATHASFYSFDPSGLARSANANLQFAVASIAFGLFNATPGSAGPASFNRVGAIALEFVAIPPGAVDLQVALIETSGQLVLTKVANLTTDLNGDAIANAGDVITYNLTLSYSSLGSPVTNVYLWDDPSRDFKVGANGAGAAYFPYYSLVPGSLIVITSRVDPNTFALSPANFSFTELNGPNVNAGLGRVVLSLGSVAAYTSYNVFFAIRVQNTLPCCLPTCRASCSLNTGGESCYCIANTAYYCENQDGVNLVARDASGNMPNFTTAFVDFNCGFSTAPSSNPLQRASTTPTITVSPVYAPSSPYITFTSPAPPASVQPGAQVCGTFLVGNNGTRDTAATISFSYNSALLTYTATGSSTGFSTASSSSLQSGLVQLPSGTNFTYTLCFTANQLTTCTATQAQFSASIAPNGCNSTTITGPTGETNGVEVDGAVAVGACIDVNINDNGATSSPTVINGTAVVSVYSNFSSTTIAPSGQTTLSFCYSNTGNVPATNAVVTVSIPSGVSVTSGSSSFTIGATTATYTIGTIPSGTVCAPIPSLTVTYNAVALTCANANLNFAVSLNSDCGSASSASTVQPTGNTAISLIKTASASSVAVGSVITYTLTYTNNGSRQFDTVNLTDTVPANTVYTGGNTFTCSPNNNAGSVCTATVSASSGPVPFVVTVNPNTTCDTTSVTNTATAQGFCAGPPISFPTNVVNSTVSVTVTGNPDFFITKVATDGNGNAISTVSAGGSVTYVISYGNNGNRISSAVITEAAVGSPFTFVGPNIWTASANGYTYNLANVAPGQSGNITFVVQATSTLPNCANYTVPNTVNIAASAPCVDNNQANNAASTQASVTGTVDLYIYYVNQTSIYTLPAASASLEFCYGNLGNTGASNATMTVNLPAGISLTGSGNAGFSQSGQTVSYNIGYIAPNAAATCLTLQVTLPTSLNCTDVSYANTAYINSTCNEVNLTNNVTPYTFAVTALFDLYIGLSQPANASITQSSPQITYCLTYGNNGAKSVTPVYLYENLPVGTTFVASASDSRWVNVGNGIYALNVGSVGANSAYNTCINFSVTANLPIGPTLVSITDSAYISNNPSPFTFNGVCGNETTLSNNNASVTTRVTGNPDLFILKTNNGASFFGSGSVSSASTQFPGDVVVFTLSYGNNGQANAYNASITENVPLNTVYDSAHSSSAWSCADGAAALTTCTANVGTVPIAANNAQGVIYGSIQFAVRATASTGSSVTPSLLCPQPNTINNAQISVASPQVDLNQVNNFANASTPFQGLPNLYITKNVSNPTVARVSGDVITYTISYGNNGVRQALNVRITDTIPEYTIFNAAGSSAGFVCSNGGVSGSNCTFSAGNLLSGQTGSVQFAVTLQPGFPASALSTQNCVEISNNCFGGNETTLVDNTACAVVPITGYYDLVLQKHGYCESILFTLNYENVGTIGARDVFLKTYIPQDTTFDANNSAAGWICNANTPGAECRYPVTSVDPRNAGVLDYLAPQASGSVSFAVTPYSSSMSSTFTLDSSIDDNFTGDNLDPTPDNNRASTTVGFSGCAACDSCCPAVDQCCPDYTDVSFVFGGVLDGLNTCS